MRCIDTAYAADFIGSISEELVAERTRVNLDGRDRGTERDWIDWMKYVDECD